VQGAPVDVYPRVPPEALRGQVRRITEVGEEILRRRCRPVTGFGTAELASLIDDMFATCHIADGAAIAANQIDVDLRLFVWDMTDEWGVRHVGHIANPELELPPVRQRRLVEEDEGCLSVPGPSHPLARADFAVVRGYDRDGEPVEVVGRGYFARCLQHEYDHLEGRTYLDLLSPRQRRAVLREMERMRPEVYARRQAGIERLRRDQARLRGSGSG